MPDLEDCIEDIKELNLKVQANTFALTEIKIKLEAISQQNASLETILKYVVTPLLGIVGALVGVNLLG